MRWLYPDYSDDLDNSCFQAGSCANCERIVQAPAPSRPIERGLAGPNLLAHVLVAKYCDHQPLYRQAEMYAREGVELERSSRSCRRSPDFVRVFRGQNTRNS